MTTRVPGTCQWKEFHVNVGILRHQIPIATLIDPTSYPEPSVSDAATGLERFPLVLHNEFINHVVMLNVYNTYVLLKLCINSWIEK